MQKKFITIARENKNADFYLVCHTACNELGNFQWFLKDDPNSEHEVNLENQVYESFSTDSNWIKENAENKWLGCHCLLKDDEYTEMICHLSSDILTMLRNNIFDMISTFNSQGNFDHSYILEN
uniref:hypothetical protein n=1 Tax=[Lactobacillus] rogosae TaxID=706562 RepID=UPI00402ACDD0